MRTSKIDLNSDPFNPSQSILQRISHSDNVGDAEKEALQSRKVQSSPFLHRAQTPSPITHLAKDKVPKAQKSKAKRKRACFTPEELPDVNISSYQSSQVVSSLEEKGTVKKAGSLDEETKGMCKKAMLLLASLTGKSRPLLIHALIAHSGDIANAYFYLMHDRMDKCWRHTEDMAILQGNLSDLRNKWSEKDIAARQAFLNGLCEAP